MQQSDSRSPAPGSGGSVLCPSCGHLVPPHAHFCGNCGNPLPVEAQPTSPLPSRHLPSTPPSAPAPSPTYEPGFPPTQAPGSAQPVGPAGSQPGHGQHSHPPVVEETAGGEATQAADKSEEEKSPWKILQERIWRPEVGPWPLQTIMWMLVGQIVLVLVLLITQHLPQPVVDSGVNDFLGGRYVATVPIFVVLNLSLVLGYWFTLAGALRTRWFIGLPIVAGVIYVLANVPYSKIMAGVGVWENWGQLGLLALLGVWELGIVVWQWFTPSSRHRQAVGEAQTGAAPSQGPPGGPTQSAQSAADASRSQLLRGGSFLGVLALLLGYYGLELVIWASEVSAHQVGAANTFLLLDLGTQFQLLTTLLIAVLLLGSTDILEWGEIAVTSGWQFLKLTRRPWLLWACTLLAALATIAKVLISLGSGVLFALLVTAVLALLLWGLLRLMPLASGWSEKLRTPAVRIGAILIYCYLILISDVVTSEFAIKWGLLVDFYQQFFSLVVLPIGLAALATGLFVLLRGQRQDAKWQGLWLFAVLVLTMLVVATVALFLDALNLGAFFPLKAFQSGVQLCAGLAVLVWTVSLVARRRVAGADELLGHALLLLVGLQMVFWVQNLLDFISTLQANSTLGLALLFLLTTGWGLLTTGDTVQLNGQPPPSSRFYPREVRVLLYAGSTLIATVLLLYLGSLHVSTIGASSAAYLSEDVYSPLGLSVLGSLIVIMAFLQHMPQPAPARTPSPQPARAISWAVLGSGALLAVLLMGFVLSSAVPHLLQRNAQELAKGYSTAVPGPDCDPGGASWALTPNAVASTRCLSKALQVTDSSQGAADIKFQPPSGQFSENYSVSVRVNIGQIANGCVGLITRFSTPGLYQNLLCTDGSWAINLITPSSSTTLAHGRIPRTTVATLGAISSGANQRLTINGLTVGTVSDSTLTQGSVWLTLKNLVDSPAIAQFSQFQYNPLPASAGSPAPSAYRASVPGPACDHNGAQWAEAFTSSGELQCLSTGLQMNLHQLAVVEFTPPSGLFPRDYQVSLTVNLRNLPFGCAGIITRATGSKFYWNRVCNNGLLAGWSIALVDNGTSKDLIQGPLVLADVYALTATTIGSQQTLAINGQQVGSTFDSTCVQTANLGLEAYSLLPGQASAVVSDFVYTPLA